MTVFFLVMLFGGLGAVSRHWVNGVVSRRMETRFPAGTFVVNISGAFVAGFIAGLFSSFALFEPFLMPVLIGYLGAYTTFSTWMVQSAGQIESKEWKYLFLNTIGSLALGIIAALAGLHIARLLPY